MSFRDEVSASARLDFGELRRSRWYWLASGAYVLLAAGLLLVGARESTVLGFTSMGRVVLSFAHVLLVVVPLLALSATTQMISRARDDGTIELFFSHPLSRSAYLLGITLTRFAALALPLALAIGVMGGLGLVLGNEPPSWSFIGRAIAIGASLTWSFVGVGLAISVGTRHQARAVVLGLLTWSAAVALVDMGLIGLLLQWRVEPRVLFAIAAANPVQSARLGLLAGLEPDLGTLGPVGFYLTHSVGADALVALGVAWPFALGTVALGLAHRAFRRGDLV